jgi:hypothetical protein
MVQLIDACSSVDDEAGLRWAVGILVAHSLPNTGKFLPHLRPAWLRPADANWSPS